MHHSYIDQYSYQSSPLHDLDPRIKIIVVFFYTLAVVSLSKYKLMELIPFAILPLLWIPLGKTPWKFVFKHLLAVSPFILMMALFNPLHDRVPIEIGGLTLRRGWISGANICFKFTLSVFMLMALVSTTPFPKLLWALQKLRFPPLLLLQLSFLYRYIFITIDEGEKMLRARSARSYGHSLTVKKAFFSGGSLLGALFFRCLERAEKVYYAMKARGMGREIRLATPLKSRPVDWIFLAGSLLFVIFFYLAAL